MSKFEEFEVSNFFELQKMKFDHFAKIALRIAKSEYFVDIQNGLDSPINCLSKDV